MRKSILGCIAFMTLSSSLGQTSKAPDQQKEYMYFVYSDGNRVSDLSSTKQQIHIQKIGKYIAHLAQSGKLKSAQPLEMAGIKVGTKQGIFTESALNKDQKTIAGYYHILAANLKEAIAIAQADPRFEEEGWEIEIRTIKKVEGINNK